MYNVFHKLELMKKRKEYNKVLLDVKKIVLNNLNKTEDNLISLIKESKNDNDRLAYITLLINIVYNINVYDEQILGAVALYNNNVLDMKTGEGKTIVALISSILHVLNGKKVHLVTANDYLVQRDFKYGHKILNKLNIKSSFIYDNMRISEKRVPYLSDIVYGTAKTFCFDFLNDLFIKDQSKKIFRNMDVVIIDEIDFILIEEARSPIAISGKEDEEGLSILTELDKHIKDFKEKEDFIIEDKSKNIEFNENGFKKFEDLLIHLKFIKNKTDLYTKDNTQYLQFFNQTIKAYFILKKDIDYVILEDKIVIVDENTGRLVSGKTWNNGLHQALEIKEKLKINKDSKTLASTSLQGFFSKYKEISGMSGTSNADSIEFKDIYDLDVIEIPTHKKSKRLIIEDVVFVDKHHAIKVLLEDIKKNNSIGRPILIGTTNIKDSELIYKHLIEENIPCEILNAKNNEKESLLIESAGKLGKITISTNMAGRGTDIMLGGNRDTEIENLIMYKNITYEESNLIWKEVNEKINALGGLYVIGFGRSSSRKLDNQLMGRCARQGDNGSCRFYLTLEDELLSIFGKSAKMLFNTITMGVKDIGVSDRIINNNIIEVQKKSENLYFNYRKSLLRYSQISEKQFEIINNLRTQILNKTEFSSFIKFIAEEVFNYIKEDFNSSGTSYYSLDVLFDLINKNTGINRVCFDNCENINDIEKEFFSLIDSKYKEKLNYFEDSKSFEKNIIIDIIDSHWVDHLTALENIKKGTSFRNVAQKNPFEEFKNESFKIFDFLIKQIFIDSLNSIINIDPIDLLRNIEDNKQDFEFNNDNYIFLGNIKSYGF